MKARQPVRAPVVQVARGSKFRSPVKVPSSARSPSRFHQKQRSPSPLPRANRISSVEQTRTGAGHAKNTNHALACLVLDSVYTAVSVGVQSCSALEEKTHPNHRDDVWGGTIVSESRFDTRRSNVGGLQALARDGLEEGRFTPLSRPFSSAGHLGHLMMTPSIQFDLSEDVDDSYDVIPREKQEILQLVEDLQPIFKGQSAVQECSSDLRRVFSSHAAHLSNLLRVCDANIAYLQGRRDVGFTLFPPLEASARPDLSGECVGRLQSTATRSSKGRRENIGQTTRSAAESSKEHFEDHHHHRCTPGACLLDYDRMTAREMTVDSQHRIADMMCIRCVYEEEMARQSLVLCEDQWRTCLGILWYASDILDVGQDPSLSRNTPAAILPPQMSTAAEGYRPVSAAYTMMAYEKEARHDYRSDKTEHERVAVERRDATTQTSERNKDGVEIAKWKTRATHAAQKVTDLEAQIATVEESVRGATSTADALRIENETLRTAVRDMESKIVTLTGEFSEKETHNQRSLDALREQLKTEAVSLVESHQQEIKEYAHLLREETTRCETFESTIRELEVWVKDLRERNVALEVLNVDRKERKCAASFVDHHHLQERLLAIQTFFISAMYSTRCDLEWMEHNEWMSLMDTAAILREVSRRTKDVLPSVAVLEEANSAGERTAGHKGDDAFNSDEFAQRTSTRFAHRSSRGSILAPPTVIHEQEQSYTKLQHPRESVTSYDIRDTHSTTTARETYISTERVHTIHEQNDMRNDGATTRPVESISLASPSPAGHDHDHVHHHHRHQPLQRNGGRKSRSCSPGKTKERALVLTEMALPFKSSSSNASNDTDTCYCFYMDAVSEVSGPRNVDGESGDTASGYAPLRREPSPVPVAPGIIPDPLSSFCSISPITQRRSGTNDNSSDVDNEVMPEYARGGESVREPPIRTTAAPPQQHLMVADGYRHASDAPVTRTDEMHFTYVRTSNTATYFATSPERTDSHEVHAFPPLPPRPAPQAPHEALPPLSGERGGANRIPAPIGSTAIRSAPQSAHAFPPERVDERTRIEELEKEDYEDSDDGDSDDDLVMLEITRPGGFDGLLQRERALRTDEVNENERSQKDNFSSPQETYLKDPLVVVDTTTHTSTTHANGHPSNASLNRSPPLPDGASTLLEEERQLLREVQQSLSAMSSPNTRTRHSDSGSPHVI